MFSEYVQLGLRGIVGKKTGDVVHEDPVWPCEQCECARNQRRSVS